MTLLNCKTFLTILAVCECFKYGVSMEEELEGFKLLKAQSSRCFCPGEGLVLQCAINGPGFTRLTVRAENGVDCLGDSLFFSHTDFDENNPVTAECVAGGVRIIARGIGNNADLHISTVNITALPRSGSLTVQCFHFNGTYDRQIGTSQTSTATVAQAVSDIQYDNSNHYSWDGTSAPPGCQVYFISSVNCGRCPERTVDTFVECSYDQPGTQRNCNFSVTASVCGMNETTTATFLIPSTSNTPTTAEPSSGPGLSDRAIGEIVGGVLGVIAVVAVVAVVILIGVIWSKRRGCFAERSKQSDVELTNVRNSELRDKEPDATDGPGQQDKRPVDGGLGQPNEQPGDGGAPGQPDMSLADLSLSDEQDVETSVEETQMWQEIEQDFFQHGNQNDRENLRKCLQKVKQLVGQIQVLQKNNEELERKYQDLNAQLDQERKKNEQSEEENVLLKQDKERLDRELQKIAADKEAQEKRLNEVIQQLKAEVSTLHKQIADLQGDMEQERTERNQAIEYAIEQEKTEREKAMEQERAQNQIDMSNFQQRILKGVSEIINNNTAVNQQRLLNFAQNVNVPGENPVNGSKDRLGIAVKTEAAGESASQTSYMKEGSGKIGQGLTTLTLPQDQRQ